MRRYLALALACVLAAISISALAMGLGEIRLNSYLNQRLDAEIELVSAAADEIESLKVKLADDSVFERYGLERTALLNTLQFNVVRRPNGTAYVHVTSTEPIREPFLTLLVVADWSRGRLVREYTLLIDPPTFAGREQAAEAEAPAVVPQPEPAIEAQAPAEEAVEQPEPVQQPTLAEPVEEQGEAGVTETRAGDVISIPPLEAEAERPVRREPVQAEPQLGGNYGPIQRNETLWGIAQRLRPDESVTINQMMIALFRANPEAFQGNINRLKAGYILRVPGYAEISALARSEAFNEVKRQNEEWRGDTTSAQPSIGGTQPVEAEPELSLVAPEEDVIAESDVGAGDEAEGVDLGSDDPLDLAGDDADEGAVDLGVEAESADRLLDIEDESLQALQEQDELLAEEPIADEPVLPESEEALTEEQVTEPLPLPEEGMAEGMAEGEVAPEQETQAPQEAVVPAEQAPVAEEAQLEPDSSAIVPVPVRAEPGLVDQLKALALSPVGLGVGAAILVLLLAGVLVMRKRREASQGRTAAAMADWSEDEASDVTVVAGRDEDEDVTVVTGRDAPQDIGRVFSHGMDHEDTGTTKLDEDDAATQLLDAEKTQMLKSKTTDFTETVVGGGQAVTLDDNDPLSEADFHMAYGLYDQAAEVVQKAVSRDPSRKEYHAKLAEIYFAGNNTGGFLDAARQLRELAGPGDPVWDNVAIMGRQIAPEEDMFAEGGATAAVDLDFGSAAEEFGTAEPAPPAPKAAPAEDSLDFDLDLDSTPAAEPEPELPAEESADSADSMDFDLDIGGTQEAEISPQPLAAEPDTSGDFDFDLGETDDSSEDAPAEATPAFDDDQTQTEFDKALQELSAFVDTNVPEQDAGDAVEADAGLNLDEYSFDQDASALDDELAGTGTDEEDIGEIGTKLDLARAYIDMGDPDGARGILEEVMSDGDAEQQKEARELLDQLG